MPEHSHNHWSGRTRHPIRAGTSEDMEVPLTSEGAGDVIVSPMSFDIPPKPAPAKMARSPNMATGGGSCS